MNKYLIVVVVSVLALTGCNNGSKKEEKLLADCYAKSEAIATGEIDFKSQDVIDQMEEEMEKRKQYREQYGVSVEGYITQAGRDRCKRLIELGEYP